MSSHVGFTGCVQFCHPYLLLESVTLALILFVGPWVIPLHLKKIDDEKNTLNSFMTFHITSHVQACFKSNWSGIVVLQHPLMQNGEDWCSNWNSTHVNKEIFITEKLKCWHCWFSFFLQLSFWNYTRRKC